MRQRIARRYLLIIALVSLQSLTHLYLSFRTDRAMVGFLPAYSLAKGQLIDHVLQGLPAQKAGLEDGDLIVGVDNHAVRSFDEYNSVKLHYLQAGKPSQFYLVRNGEKITRTVTPYSRLIPIKFLVAVILVLGCLILGAFCYLRNPSDPRTRMLLLIFLSFAAVDSFISDTPFGNWPVDRFLNVLLLLMDGFGYGLLTLLPFFVPERKQFLVRRPWLSILFLAPGVLYGILEACYVDYAIRTPGSELFSYDYLAVFSEYYLNAIFLGTPLVLYHTLKKASSPQVQSQAKTIVTGVTCWALLNSLVISLQTIYPDSWIADGYYATIVDIIIPISVFFAVYRHKLFDIDVLLRKGLIYTAVSGILFSIYLLAIGVLGSLIPAYFSKEMGLATNSISTLLVGLAFIPVRHYSQRFIDRFFYREKYNYLEIINTVFDEMPAAFSLEKLVETLSSRIYDAMRIKNLAVLIPDEEHSRYFLRNAIGEFPASDLENRVLLLAEDSLIQKLLSSGAAVYGKTFDHLALNERERQTLSLLGTRLAMPVLHQKKLVAVLLLGEKQSEMWLDADDVGFLTTVCRQAAMLMENARLFELATFDGLTQLMRRSAFDSILETESQRSRRYRRPLSLVMVDIDHFKKLNDTYGHQVGDLALKKVAATLKASLRQTDTPSRYGGEEFAILLPETAEGQALVAAENLRARIEGLELKLDDVKVIRITASLGIYTADGSEIPPPEELYRRADSALYRAKSSGRNRVESFGFTQPPAAPVI